jgi:hypothetical protein
LYLEGQGWRLFTRKVNGRRRFSAYPGFIFGSDVHNCNITPKRSGSLNLQEANMQIYNDHHNVRANTAHAEMDAVAWIGLGLSLLGLAAFGAYTAFFLAGFINDLMA